MKCEVCEEQYEGQLTPLNQNMWHAMEDQWNTHRDVWDLVAMCDFWYHEWNKEDQPHGTKS